jgi:hypothetical protein
LKKNEEWFLGLVRQEPDLTLEEPASSARRASSKSGAWFGLADLRPSRHQLQKKAFERPSRIDLTLPRRERHGPTINPSSIPTD